MDIVGQNKKLIAEYIKNHLEEDYGADQINISHGPVYGGKNK